MTTQEIRVRMTLEDAGVEAVAKKSAAAILGVGAAANTAGAQAGPAMAKAAQGLAQVEMSTKAMTSAMRSVPQQFTDIFVSLASGQSPLTVALQQGGQLKDMFHGIGPAARAMGTYVAGLATPFGVAAAGVVGLGVAYYQGTERVDKFNAALLLSGNIAGETVGRLSQVAMAAGAASGGYGASAEAVAAMAASGRIAGDQMERVAAIAAGYDERVGTPVADTVKKFEDLAKSPVEASAKLNESEHFLTEAVWEQIKALEAKGRTVEAGRLAVSAYADVSSQRISALTAQLGTFEGAWATLSRQVSRTWAEITGAMSAADLAENRLAQEQAKLSRMQKDPNYWIQEGIRAKDPDQQARLVEDLKIEQRDARVRAANRAMEQKQADARVKWDQDGEKYAARQDQRDKEALRIRREGLAAGRSEAEIAARIAASNEKLKDPKAPKARSGGAGLRGFAREQSAEVAFENAKAAQEQRYAADLVARDRFMLEQKYAAGRMLAEDYYDGLRQLADEESAASLDAIEAKIAAEEGRKTKTKADGLKRRAALLELHSARAHQLSVAHLADMKLEADGEAAAAKAFEAQIERRSALMDKAREFAGQTGDANASAALSQIQDPNTRAMAEVSAQVAELRRASREIQQKLTLEMELTLDEDQAAAMKARIEDIAKQTEESVRLAFAGMSEQIKPAWQKMVEGWGDAQRLMRESSDETMGKMVQGAEEAFVSFAQTGKLNTKSLVDMMVGEFARLQYRKFVGELSNSGSILSALAGMFGGSSSASRSTSTVGVDSVGLGGMAADGATFSGAAARFANGGTFTGQLVAGPTMFRYRDGGQFRAGLMGEAGPEAVVPVRAAAGGYMADTVDPSGRRVGQAMLARSSSGRLSILAEGHKRFANGGVFGTMAPAAARGGAEASAAAVTINAPIHIDSRTDQAAVRGEVRRGISDALREYTKAMASAKKRSGG